MPMEVLVIYVEKMTFQEFATSPEELSQVVTLTRLVAIEFILTHHQTDSTKTNMA